MASWREESSQLGKIMKQDFANIIRSRLLSSEDEITAKIELPYLKQRRQRLDIEQQISILCLHGFVHKLLLKSKKLFYDFARI